MTHLSEWLTSMPFTYKWGEDVRDGILETYFYLYPTDVSRSTIEACEFIIYAFDMQQRNQKSDLIPLIDEIFELNSEMVKKAIKNSKIEGWFLGQIMKKNEFMDINPQTTIKLISEKINKLR